MPRWLRVVRGMVGTGLTFGAGVAVLGSVVGTLAWLGNGMTGREAMQIVGKTSVVAFLLGVAFSGVLALTARGRDFSKLSLKLVGGLGTGAGLLYFGFLAVNGGRNWSRGDAIANFVILTVMGAGAAIVTLALARKAGSSLEAGDEVAGLGAGDPELVRTRNDARVEVPRR